MKSRKFDAIIFGLGVPLPHKFSASMFLKDLWTYFNKGAVLVNYERKVSGRRILFITTRMGTGSYWDFEIYLPHAKYAVGIGLCGVFTGNVGDVFIPSSAILLPEKIGGEIEERKPSASLHNLLMRKANEHDLKPYDGRVCTVYNPFHGRTKEVHDSGCKGQEQETWFLFDESRKFGNEVASILIISDVCAKNAEDVTEQIKVRESMIRKVHKKIIEKVVLDCLLHLLV